MHILGLTLKECALFLYDQWYHLSEQRYNKLKEEMVHLYVEKAKEPPKQEGEMAEQKQEAQAQEEKAEQNEVKMDVEAPL